MRHVELKNLIGHLKGLGEHNLEDCFQFMLGLQISELAKQSEYMKIEAAHRPKSAASKVYNHQKPNGNGKYTITLLLVKSIEKDHLIQLKINSEFRNVSPQLQGDQNG